MSIIRSVSRRGKPEPSLSYVKENILHLDREIEHREAGLQCSSPWSNSKYIKYNIILSCSRYTRPRNTDLLQETLHENLDILSYTIIYQLWHIADIIFQNLDALSLLNCEKAISRHFALINQNLFMFIVYVGL